MEIKTKATFFLANILLALRQEWTAVLNQTTWDVIPCSIEERLDISIVKTHTHIQKKKSEGERKRGSGNEREASARTKKRWRERSGERTRASGTVKQSDIDSAMALWLWLRHAHPSASHMWGGYWWSRHIQAEHLLWNSTHLIGFGDGISVSLSLPLSHSCSLVFIAQPQPSCMGHIHRHTQYRVLFGVQHIGIILPFTTVSCCLPSLDLSVNSAF